MTTYTISPQLDVVYEFLRISKNTSHAELADILHDSFKFKQLPSSYAKVFGTAEPMGKQEYLDLMINVLLKSFKSFQFTPHEVNESPGRVWLYLTSVAVLLNGDTLNGEYVFMFDLATDGTPKITSCKEFLDSEISLKALEANTKAREALTVGSD